MANPAVISTQAFQNNVLLVKALMLMVSPEEYKRALEWVTELSERTTAVEEMATKNEYLWYLLLVLQSGNLLKKPPFDKPPPVAGLLKPLASILSPTVYEEVVKGTESEIFFSDILENLEKKKLERNLNKSKSPDGSTPPPEEDSKKNEQQAQKKTKRQRSNAGKTEPSKFFEEQPRPSNGTICYACVFSDYND